eukprot:GHVH01006631.1.p1 GENE.GHVH01006631.1~~GHVH01006631.1.p1  ORF type:complete len:111 (+),score=10.59 GHVH01006631.1:289-621(+)
MKRQGVQQQRNNDTFKASRNTDSRTSTSTPSEAYPLLGDDRKTLDSAKSDYIYLEKTFHEDAPPVLVSTSVPIPTFSNAQVDNRAKKMCLRQLLTQGSIVPAEDGSPRLI